MRRGSKPTCALIVEHHARTPRGCPSTSAVRVELVDALPRWAWDRPASEEQPCKNVLVKRGAVTVTNAIGPAHCAGGHPNSTGRGSSTSTPRGIGERVHEC